MQVFVNNFLSNPILLERDVRQGDALPGKTGLMSHWASRGLRKLRYLELFSDP